MTKFKYIKNNWKLGIHLLLRTKRFGVNNLWWSSFDSFFGQPFRIIIIINIFLVRPILDNYRQMKFRATACHFVSDNTKKIMGWNNLSKNISKKEIF